MPPIVWERPAGRLFAAALVDIVVYGLGLRYSVLLQFLERN